MTFSSIPFLIAILWITVAFYTLKTRRDGAISTGQFLAVSLVLGYFLVWTFISAHLSRQGLFRNEEFLDYLPGLWLPMILVLGVQPLRFSRSGRQALLAIMDRISPKTIVWIEGLRIASLGTLFKTLQGQFPVHFEISTGVADLIFGLSAIVVLYRLKRGTIGWKGLMVWHVAGLMIILPASLFIQLGMPGALQVFYAEPNSLVVFDYPMVLAPTVAVPFLALLNGWSAVWLKVRKPEDLNRSWVQATQDEAGSKASA